MKDILDAFERLFGTRLLIFALTIVVVYIGVQSLIKLIALLSDKSRLESHLSTIKTHFEIIQIEKQLEALKKNSQLDDHPDEEALKVQLHKLVPQHSSPGPLDAFGSVISREISALARRSRILAILLYIGVQLGLRTWGLGMLAFTIMVAIFGDDYLKTGAHWDNIIIIDVLILLGFWFGNIAIRGLKTAGLKDSVGYWSYVVGFVIATFLVWHWSVSAIPWFRLR